MIGKKYISKLDHDHQYRRSCFILVRRKPDSLMVGLLSLVQSDQNIRTPPIERTVMSRSKKSSEYISCDLPRNVHYSREFNILVGSQ